MRLTTVIISKSEPHTYELHNISDSCHSGSSWIVTVSSCRDYERTATSPSYDMHIYVNKIFTIYLLLMKSWHEKDEEFSDDKKKQTQTHMIALIISSAILVLGLIAAPSMIYAQNTTSAPSNATTVEGHTTNTTGTPLNTTSTAPKPADG